MQNYLAIYRATDAARRQSGWDALSKEVAHVRRAVGSEAWNAWVETHRTAIVDQGSPIGRTKRADAGGLSDGANTVAVYTIVRADSHDAAACTFENHPHFTIFPGEAVEIMPCLPLPGRHDPAARILAEE